MSAGTVGSRIRKLRIANNLTASELARKVSVSPTAVANWENGSIPRSAALGRLAKTLDVSQEYLISGKDKSADQSMNVQDIIKKATVAISKASGVPLAQVKLTLEIKSK